MDDEISSASQPGNGSTNKTEMKSQVSQSMEHLRDVRENQNNDQVKENKNNDQPKKGNYLQPKYVGRNEADVGIKEFLDSSEGFTGITKHRWSDFIVHEIDLSGEVVTLTDISVPAKEKQAKVEAVRPEWFPEAVWDKLVELSAMEKSKDPVHVPAGQLSKEQRTQYHTTIKSCFPKMVTNTCEVDGEKMISVMKANAAPDRKNTFWRHKPWPKDRPKFLHFCLFKENLDTFVALSNLSMDLKVKSNKLSFAGTKDARAKTTQMVSVKQITAEKVHEAARKFSRMAVGNFSYKDSELKLGDLKGNQFDLVLRHVQGSDDVIGRRVASFESLGFINYYGLQRFGGTSSGTHEVGRAILRREWRVAVDLLLSGRENDSGPGVARAHRAWHADRDPRRALSLLSGKLQRTTIEGRVLHTLCTVRANAYQEAMDRLPAGTRQLYVHAYQSWLWNRVASRRLAEHGLKLRPGDLVLAGDQPAGVADEPPSDDPNAVEVDPNAVEIDPSAAEVDPSAAEADPSAESEPGAAEGGRNPQLPRLPEVRVLTEAELSAHSIYDLVLPLPGWAVRYPENEAAGWFAELLAADGIELSRERCDALPQYSMAGAYRPVLARPGAVSWRMMRYSDPGDELLLSDLDRLRGVQPPADQPGAPFRALLMQFTLPSSVYATMAVREITGTESGLASQMQLNEAYNAELRRIRDAAKGEEPAEGKREGGDGAAEKGGQDAQGQKRQGTDGDQTDEKRQKTDDAA